MIVEELEKLAKETEFAAGLRPREDAALGEGEDVQDLGHLPYYAESMFPPMEMDEHREDRKKLEARIAELEKQLQDYAKKIIGEKAGN